MSDLHIEFGHMPIPTVLGDVLILAGDIHVGSRGIDWINECALIFPHVIYILGNHEYYGHDIKKLSKEIAVNISDNVHLLDNNYVEIEKIRFLGSTLWSDIGIPAANSMNDFYRIVNGKRTFSRNDAIERHNQALSFLQDNINKDKINVVITHHCPSVSCVNIERYSDDKMNTGYYTNILHLFKNKVRLWICGHTHISFDFIEEGINVVGNCRGYINYEENPSFNPNKIVEI